jgi:hypothetical protein
MMRCLNLVVGGAGVRVLTVRRVHVNDGVGEAADPVQEVVAGLLGDVVGLADRHVAVHGDVQLGVQLVPDPADPDAVAGEHRGDGPRRARDLLGQRRVDGVHQPPVDVTDRAAQHRQDRDRDQQADHRVGLRPAEGHPAGPDHDGQAGEPVGAGVPAVGGQGGRADPGAHPDAVARGQLVADEADDPGGGHPRQVVHPLRVDEPLDGLPGGHDGGRRHHDDHGEAGQVLGPAVPVGVAAIRRASGGPERQADGQRGQGVGQVVDRVGEQPHRPAEAEDHRLDDPGRQQAGEAHD